MNRKAAIISFLVLIVLTISYFNFHYKSQSLYGVEILDLTSNNKHLLFYGSAHSNDKANPMFKQIEKYFNAVKPQVVLVEGDMNKEQYADRDEAIMQGESAFVSYLAQKGNIELDSVEPSMKEQFDYLLKKYDKNNVLLMYVFRQIFQFQSQQKNAPINFQQALETFINGMAKHGFPLNDQERKPDHIINLVQLYMKQEINEENWTKINVYDIYKNSNTEINTIYNDVLQMRDQHLLSSIESHLKSHDRVFVIMGSTHVKMQKAHIQQIFSEAAKPQ